MRKMSSINGVVALQIALTGSGMLLAYFVGKHGDALGGFKAEALDTLWRNRRMKG